MRVEKTREAPSFSPNRNHLLEVAQLIQRNFEDDMTRKLVFFFIIISHYLIANEEQGKMAMEYWLWGEHLQKEHRLEEAIEAYTTAIEIEESYRGENQYDIYLDRADLLAQLGHLDFALDDYKVVLERASVCSPLWNRHITRALKGIQLIKNSACTLRAPFREGLICLAKYSDKEIQNEKDTAKNELSMMNQDIYDMGREALNGHPGEVAHHGIQAGSHALSAWEHYREACRMERENEESRGTWDRPGDSRD